MYNCTCSVTSSIDCSDAPPTCNVAEVRKDEADSALLSLLEATPGTENSSEDRRSVSRMWTLLPVLNRVT